MAPSTVTSLSPQPSTTACSSPTPKDPTSTARFETASPTLDSGGPDDSPFEWALQNSGQQNKRHWAEARPTGLWHDCETVKEEGHELRKELGLGDLVLAQVLCVVGS